MKFRILSILLLVASLTGCASMRPQNKILVSHDKTDGYNLATNARKRGLGNVLIMASFSGGGTRAAALSFGVLEALRETVIDRGEVSYRLLDELDGISSVSGGSFTAAYYGLQGEKIFDQFEDVFLTQNVQKNLILGLLNPIRWIRSLFKGFDRTEMAIDYYNDNIFNGATFKDMKAAGGPFVEINATDLTTGTRFGFSQVQFDVICSDILQFQVARAVASSSAVPVAFAPSVLKNYAGECEFDAPAWSGELDTENEKDSRRQQLWSHTLSYLNTKDRPFIHLVDGGIADNLGLRATLDRLIVLGGAQKVSSYLGAPIPDSIVFILVNADTKPKRPFGLSPDEPSFGDVVDAVSDIQIKRYNIETLELMRKESRNVARELGSVNENTKVYFIEVSFEALKDEKERLFFNNIKTTLALEPDEIHRLREAGRHLFLESPEFRRLQADLNGVDSGLKSSPGSIASEKD